MTVRELIEVLEEFSDHVEVKLTIPRRETETYHGIAEVYYYDPEACVVLEPSHA